MVGAEGRRGALGHGAEAPLAHAAHVRAAPLELGATRLWRNW